MQILNRENQWKQFGLALVCGWVFSLFPCALSAQEKPADLVRFVDTSDVIPIEQRSRRKFDSPVVVDLDQDGKLDLLLTDHSRRLQVYWNQGKDFSEPVRVYDGDSHGVTAGDIDRDGLVELIVSQGGGGGKKPRNPVLYEVSRDRKITGGDEFEHFERTRGRATKLFDSTGSGELDLLLTAFPLETQTKGANDLYRNAGDSNFEFDSKLPTAQWMGFRSRLTDYNNDHRTDVLFYGGKNFVLARSESDGSFKDVSEEVFGVAANTGFVSAMAEIDYDNDGDFDLFLTRADHPFESKKYYDGEGQRFAFFARFKPLEFEDLKINGEFKLENLQMAYPDFDVLVGKEKRKLEFEVDRHGHKDFVLKPEEAEGWPEDTSAKALYIGHVGDGLWRMYSTTKSATAGVIHNVVSAPKVTEIPDMPCILLENREGQFADVTSRLGIKINEQTSNAVVGDFNNDGWSDLFIIKHGNPAKPTEQIVLMNQEGKWFQAASDHGIVSKELGSNGMSGEAFDYDQDGDLDIIYCNERGRWHFLKNESPECHDNHFVVVKVGSSPSSKATPMGATLTLKSGGQTYRRVVGTNSSAYSQSLNNQLHVGLGKTDKVDTAEVRWTTGETSTVKIDEVDRMISVGKFGNMPD